MPDRPSLSLRYQLGSHWLPSFVSSVPAFRNGHDSPRLYLERCITRIDALERQVPGTTVFESPKSW